MSQGYKTWWRVGVAEVSQSESVSKAYQMMQEQIETVRQY